jgi:hypothetical protein
LGSCLCWDQRHRARLPWRAHGRRSGVCYGACNRGAGHQRQNLRFPARCACCAATQRCTWSADTPPGAWPTLPCPASPYVRRHGLTCCLHVSSESLTPKASPKPSRHAVAGAWLVLAGRELVCCWPGTGVSYHSGPQQRAWHNPQAPRETSAKSAQRNASPFRRRRRPVTAQRIMQRANAHAGAYLHDSSSIKALPPQTAMCCHAARGDSCHALAARLQELHARRQSVR